MTRTGAFLLQESIKRTDQGACAFCIIQLQRLARCEKDDGPHKAKNALWANPYFLHELPRRLRFLYKIYYNNKTCLMKDKNKGDI